MGHRKSMGRTLRLVLLSLAFSLLVIVEQANGPRAKASQSVAAGQQGVKPHPVPGGALGDGEKLESANITLTPEGFTPRELMVPAGAVLLSVKKRVAERNVVLELRVEGRDELIWRAGMPEKVWNWSEIVRLHPGKYVLSVADNPDWVCRITTTPREHS